MNSQVLVRGHKPCNLHLDSRRRLCKPLVSLSTRVRIHVHTRRRALHSKTRAYANKNNESASQFPCAEAFAALALLALVQNPACASDALETPTPSKFVPLKRNVVEDMLVARFKSNLKAMSDAELAQVTEQLMTDTSPLLQPFPIHLLRPPPTSSSSSIPPPKQQPSLPVEENDERDATKDLLAVLQSATTSEESNTPRSTTSDLDIFGIPLSKIGRILGVVGAGVAVVVVPSTVLSLQRRRSSEEQSLPSLGVNTAVDSSSSGSSIKTIQKSVPAPITEKNQPGRWWELLFPGGEEASAVADEVPLRGGVEGVVAGEVAEEGQQPASSFPELLVQQQQQQQQGGVGQVLWRRKEEKKEEKEEKTGVGSEETILWKKKREDDLWRVPLESLKKRGHGQEQFSQQHPQQQPNTTDAAAAVINGNAAKEGVQRNIADSLLDNVEPPEMVGTFVNGKERETGELR